MTDLPALFVSVASLKSDPALQPGRRGARKLLVTELYEAKECLATDPVWSATYSSGKCPVQVMLTGRFVTGEYLAQIELADHVVDEVRQVIRRQPLPWRWWQQVALLCVVRLESFHRPPSRVMKRFLDVFYPGVLTQAASTTPLRIIPRHPLMTHRAKPKACDENALQFAFGTSEGPPRSFF